MSMRLAPAIAAVAFALGGCAAGRPAQVDGTVQARPTLDQAVSRALAGFVTPAWDVELSPIEPDRLRIELRSRRFFAGGEGEAYQTFTEAVRRLAADGGYAGYEILHFHEGIEATRPLTRRLAVGEFRLVRSRIWPEL